MVKLGEFFLEDRAARFEPTVDLREDCAQRETFQPFRETGQDAHDDAAAPSPGSVDLATEVGGRYVFYNESVFDGDDPAANAADDDAGAYHKWALLPGGTATSANYTGFSRGRSDRHYSAPRRGVRKHRPGYHHLARRSDSEAVARGNSVGYARHRSGRAGRVLLRQRHRRNADVFGWLYEFEPTDAKLPTPDKEKSAESQFENLHGN